MRAKPITDDELMTMRLNKISIALERYASEEDANAEEPWQDRVWEDDAVVDILTDLMHLVTKPVFDKHLRAARDHYATEDAGGV